MSILKFNNVSFEYQREELLKDVNIDLYLGDHACLIGANGAGKSTLFKLIIQELSPDSGTVEVLPTTKVGYLDQYSRIERGQTGVNYLYTSFQPLFEAEAQMLKLYEETATAAEPRLTKLLNRASEINERLIKEDFYELKTKINNVAVGLGLSISTLDLPIEQYSSGMRAKLILAKLLLMEADLLLLDEPTNFLDVAHIEWLTKFLNNYPKTYFVISHDTQFVNNIAKIIYDLDKKQVERYRGNYDYYLAEKAIREQNYQKAYKNQQDYFKKAETFINRFIAKANLTTRAQSKRKALDKITRLTPPTKAKIIKFKFLDSLPTGREVLVVDDLIIGYNGEPLLEPISLTIEKGSIVLISGKNGIGKSTLLKSVQGLIPTIGGHYHWNPACQISYFTQESTLNTQETPYQVVSGFFPNLQTKDVRSMLSNFDLDYTKQEHLLSTLSGGELTKLRMLLLSKVKSNVLILDEPTNHMDPVMKNALKEAIVSYQGTVIIVSHDLEFFDDIVDVDLKFGD